MKKPQNYTVKEYSKNIKDIKRHSFTKSTLNMFDVQTVNIYNR